MNIDLALWLAILARALPKIVGAIVVLIIGYIVAKAIGGLMGRGLRRMGLDRSVQSSPAGNLVGKATRSPSSLTGRVVFWLVWLGAISLAVQVLGIPGLTAIVGAVYAYLPNVIAALLILLVAGAVSAGLGGLVGRMMGDTPTGRMLAAIVPGVIFSIAIFMALNQLHIAEQIVTITYAAILGTLALGTALAFGLGGRDVASRLLEQAYEKGQQQTSQIREDLATGRERAGQMAEDIQEKVQPSERAAEARPSGAASPSPSFGERIDSNQRPNRETRRRRTRLE